MPPNFGNIFNPLNAPQFLDISFLGPPEGVYEARSGDLRYPRAHAELDSQMLGKLGLEPLANVGDSKVVSMAEFFTYRRTMIAENRRYFKNEPPTINLDYEDPLRDMIRIVFGIAREVILKGARFLVGKGRFEGINSLNFDTAPQTFKDGFNKMWGENNLTQKLKATSRTYLWAGDDFWKAQVDKTVRVSIDEIPAQANVELPLKEEILETDIKFTRADPEHFHAVIDPRDRSNILAWVYQFETPDKKFYREEIFRDSTLIYEGVKKKDQRVTSSTQDILSKIQGSGFAKANLKAITDSIIYTLVRKIDYPELEMFPLIVWRNNTEDEVYGTSEYFGLHGKFDALNGLVTRTLYAVDQMADPLMILTGSNINPTNQVKGADSIWAFPEKDAKLSVLQWEGSPDTVFKMIDLISTLIYRTVGVPKSSEMKAFTNVSGDALNIINTDIVDATNDRRLDLEDGLRQIVKFCRKALGQKKAMEDIMTVIWGPVFPESPKDKNSRLTALSRDKIIRKYRVVQLDPTIPPHLKEEMVQEAKDIEDKEEELKEQAILAQSPGQPAPAKTKKGGGGAQAKRFAQRATGMTKERGKSKKTLSKEE